MYSQEDMRRIEGRIRGNWMALIPVLAVILAAYVYGLVAGIKWLVMVAGPLLFVAGCYGILAHLWPNLRYRRFLMDMQSGLSRELEGTIVEISDAAEPQDGARVLPVRIFVDALQDEHIVYLNASKRDRLPGPGSRVRLRCFGRHIREAEALD